MSHPLEAYELMPDGSFRRMSGMVTECTDVSRPYPGDDAGGLIIYETTFIDGTLVCCCCPPDHHKAAVPYLKVQKIGENGSVLLGCRLISPLAYLEGEKCLGSWGDVYYLGKIIHTGFANETWTQEANLEMGECLI